MTATATATLTERYIAATIRSLKPESQADVRAELEASIADAIEARVEQGESPDAAERAVLTDLGDPGVLAAGYADRPLHLIGPKYYLVWWRLLKLLLIVVPAVVLGAVALGEAIAGAPVGEIIADSLVAAGGAAIHICFWTTLVFVVLERTGSTSTIGRWDLDQLPEVTENGGGRAELATSLGFLAFMAGLLVWDRFRGFIPGEHLPMLDPDLWPWWIGGLFVIMLLEAGLAIAVYARGRWTADLALANTVLAIVFAGVTVIMLSGGEVFNPAFVEFAFKSNGVDDGVLSVLAALVGFVVVGGSAWDIADSWIKAVRQKRA